MKQFDPQPGEKDHAWIDFETKTVLVDGINVPITLMWGKKGMPTENWQEAVIIQAGQDSNWFTLRLLD